jgi:hypothetical protein
LGVGRDRWPRLVRRRGERGPIAGLWGRHAASSSSSIGGSLVGVREVGVIAAATSSTSSTTPTSSAAAAGSSLLAANTAWGAAPSTRRGGGGVGYGGYGGYGGLGVGHGSLRVGRHRRQRGLRILCLDGGGTRGVLTVAVLQQMARAMGREIYEVFDVIAGTST